MKTRPVVALVLAALLLTCLGCASTEKTAYRVIGTVVVSVDLAMNVWGDYVRDGHAKPGDEAKVKALYTDYQSGMIAVEAVVMTSRTTANALDADSFDAAMELAQRAATTLVVAIQRLTQKPLQLPPQPQRLGRK